MDEKKLRRYIERSLVSSKVYETLRELILKNEYPPGMRLKEAELAQEFGVSRTPVREAIARLERDGLVIMIPNRGAYVRSHTVDELKEILEIRSVLEAYATRLVTERKDKRLLTELEEILKKYEKALIFSNFDECIVLGTLFHETIYNHCGNNRLIKLIRFFRDEWFRMRVMLLTSAEMAEESLRDHFELLELMREGKSDDIEGFVRNHIKKAENFLLKTDGGSNGEENKSLDSKART